MAASSAKLQLTENPGKAKVTQLDDLVFGDEDVLRLDVSVNALHQKNRPDRNKQGEEEGYHFHWDEVGLAPPPIGCCRSAQAAICCVSVTL